MANLLPDGPPPLPVAQHSVDVREDFLVEEPDVLLSVVGLVSHHVGAKHKAPHPVNRVSLVLIAGYFISQTFKEKKTLP